MGGKNANNLVAGLGNEVNEKLHLGFKRIEKVKVETDEERKKRVKDTSDWIEEKNRTKKIELEKSSKKSLKNAASERRALMFSEANEGESLKEGEESSPLQSST